MVAAAMHRRSDRGSQMVAAVIVGIGHVIGFARRPVRLIPGLGGAVLVSVGTGEIASHIFGHGLAPWIAGLVGGLFLLQIDRQTSVRPGG